MSSNTTESFLWLQSNVELMVEALLAASWPVKLALSFFGSIMLLVLYVGFRYWRTIPRCTTPETVPIHPLLQLSASEVGRRLQAGETTSVELVQLSIGVIKGVNQHINAMVFERFEAALEEAEEADAILAEARRRNDFSGVGWLTGVPCTIKECIAVKGCPQSSGLPARKAFRCSEDSIQVQRLKKAGCVVLGVTNTSELCMWMESSNYVYGTTHNAYDTTRIVGGSSGGEGCAQSAYFGFFGLGSDIGGSIRMPAYFNGVFGHKPSTLLVPNRGQHPCTQDKGNFLMCTGPICRHAEDLFPLLRTLAEGGYDKELSTKHYPRPPPITNRLPSKVKLPQLHVYCVPDLGIPLIKACKGQRDATRAACTALETQYGCKVHHVDWNVPSSIPEGWEDFRYAIDIWSSLTALDTQNFEDMMGEGQLLPDGQSSTGFSYSHKWEFFTNILGLNQQHTLPATALCVLERAQKALLSEEYKKRMCEKGARLQKAIETELGSTGVLIAPTYPAIVPKHHHPLFLPMQWVYTALFNAMQTPATAVPLWLDNIEREGGRKQMLPLGVQVVSGWGNDDLTIAVAEALDATPVGGYRPPQWAKLLRDDEATTAADNGTASDGNAGVERKTSATSTSRSKGSRRAATPAGKKKK